MTHLQRPQIAIVMRMPKRRRTFSTVLPPLIILLLILLFFHTIHPKPAPPCKSNLLLDVPSTIPLPSLTRAVRAHFRNRSVAICTPPRGCDSTLQKVCNGTLRPPKAIVGYLRASRSSTQCLRDKFGYYSAIALRSPLDRWASMYTKSSGKSYLDFMAAYPDCELLDYFDGRGNVCADDDDVRERVSSIAERFDEGFDVYEGEGGVVGEWVRKGVGDVVKERPNRKHRAFLGISRFRAEGRVYDEVMGGRGVVFCN